MEEAPRPSGQMRVVPAPVQNQGVRDALQGAFSCVSDVPLEFRTLLARLG